MAYLLWASIVLCLIAGSAIDKGNICLVRAAGSLSAGKPAKAVGILLITTCAALIFYLNSEFGLHRRAPLWFLPTLATFAGAVLFALGALLNDACAVGTLGRLARGDIGHIATFAGAAAVGFLLPRAEVPHAMPDLALLGGGWPWLLAILAFTLLVLVLCRRHLGGADIRSFIVLGFVAAVVTDWQGNWTWLGLLQQAAAGVPPGYAGVACLAAVIGGAVIGALWRGRFRLVRPDPKAMAREFAGGGLMASGAALIPGANDALSVYFVPGGSPHAVAAYGVMFVVMLAVMRARAILFRPRAVAEL